MTTLVLVRHAQATSLGDLRLPGPDPPLTPHGEAQARLLASRLGEFAPARILSSDARRALQTAAAVAQANGIPVQATPALREIDLGDWAGRTYAEVVAADPAAADWFTHPDAAAPPHGEPAADAARRVLAALRDTAGDGDESVVVIGHAGSLRLAVAEALGMPRASWWRLCLECASISVVTWAADCLILERWNDTAHLDPKP